MGIELENISTDSNWGVEAPKINTNNQKLVTEIIKAQNGEGLIKYYNTSADLNTLRPNPSNGEQAWVGTPYPGTVWNVVDGIWTDTTVVPDVNTVNLNSYVLNGGSTKTLQEIDDSKAESGGSILTMQEMDDKKLESGDYDGTAQNIIALITSLNSGYDGIASTDIINPLTQGYYISLSGGTFPNFGNISIPEGYSLIYYDNSVWKYESITLNPNNPILDTEFFT